MDLKLSLKLVLISAILFNESLAYAAAFPGIPIPASAQPEQVAKALRPKPSVVPSGVAPQQVMRSEQKAPAVSPEAQKIKFKLTQINLSGNHVFPTGVLEVLYKDKVGKEITVADLFQIVQNITNFYRNNGYIISRAILPPQHVQGGMVNIQVIEGYINNVSVSGEPHGAKCLVEGFGYRIRKCPPLQLTWLERNMLLINEIPNTTARAVLSPSTNAPGAADLTLETYSKPISAYVSYDNYGTRYIGPQQMTAGVSLYSAINSGDNINLTFTKTPKGGELTFWDLNYNGPVGDNGTRWTLGSTRVHTHPLFILAPIETDGLNTNYYTSITYPYIRTRSQSMNITAGFGYLDSNTTQFNQPFYTDHIRSLDLGFNYNFADRFYGANLISGNFRKGLPIFGYTNDTNITASTSRPGGYANYQKVAMQVSRLQSIKGPFSLLIVGKGQWGFVPLLSSEQFTFGGNPIGRGYDPAELIGDRGASGSAELRYDINTSTIIRSMQFYTFYDIGAIWNVLVNFTSPAKNSATSTGAGVRFTMTRFVSGNLMWTQPLTKQVAAQRFIGRGWAPRMFFSLVANFG